MLIDYLTPQLFSKLARCIDIQSLNALQSNNNIEIDSGDNITENDDGNEYDFQYGEKVNFYRNYRCN